MYEDGLDPVHSSTRSLVRGLGHQSGLLRVEGMIPGARGGAGLGDCLSVEVPGIGDERTT